MISHSLFILYCTNENLVSETRGNLSAQSKGWRAEVVPQLLFGQDHSEALPCPESRTPMESSPVKSGVWTESEEGDGVSNKAQRSRPLSDTQLRRGCLPFPGTCFPREGAHMD